MHEFSAADGFVEINESLAEMIKYIANEPSLGLYYIQQHAHNAIPNVIGHKNNVSNKSHETSLHTEDSEDSIAMVRSIKECGSPITHDMIGDIKSSLAIMSAKQPRRGLILDKSPWGTPTRSFSGSDYSRDVETSGYFSSVLKSAKQRAGSLRWPQLDFNEQDLATFEDRQLSTVSATTSDVEEAEKEMLPLSSEVIDEAQENSSLCKDKLPFLADDFDEFKAGREAKLKAWLGETEVNPNDSKLLHDAERI